MNFDRKETTLIFEALQNAIDWQDSLSDAHHHKGSYANACNRKSKKYKELREEIARCMKWSTKSRLDELIECATTKTIKEFIEDQKV